ncbi:MAG: site-2 protease family protein [Terrimicrobiaceae bacterium]|nr:site-2 protease family protein [Terrimicrobiaceae bacterium]
MKWSYRIARVAGIDVRVHATFLLLLAFWGYQGYSAGGVSLAVGSVLFVSLLFLCVLLHEFGHAFAARAYGIRTPDITLLPIGGVARLERMPENPIQELVIAIAGPMVNVVIALAIWAALGFPTADTLALPEGRASVLSLDLLQMNAMLVVFNLIPAFPMDGGRVLRALLALRLDRAHATRIAARIGQGIAVIFAIVGIFGIPGFANPNAFLLFIAMFVFLAAQQEAAYSQLRVAVAGMRVADAMITRFQSFPADMPLAAAVGEALHDTQPVYVVTDAQLRVVGMVPRNELLAAPSNTGAQATLGSLALAVPTVRADAPFDEAFRLMQESGSGVLPVVNPAGQIVGLVSLNLLRERAQMRK